jgi:hypothetical protein
MSEAQARLEEARLWLKATATAPLCGVSEEELTKWKAQRLADLERAAAIPPTTGAYHVGPCSCCDAPGMWEVFSPEGAALRWSSSDKELVESVCDLLNIVVNARGQRAPAIPVSEIGAHLFECQCLDCLAGLSVKEKASRTQSSPESGERA